MRFALRLASGYVFLSIYVVLAFTSVLFVAICPERILRGLQEQA